MSTNNLIKGKINMDKKALQVVLQEYAHRTLDAQVTKELEDKLYPEPVKAEPKSDAYEPAYVKDVEPVHVKGLPHKGHK
jgi:hypothetical protein